MTGTTTLTLTLDQLDAALDDYAGTVEGFAARVRRLRELRETAVAAKARQAELKAAIDAAHQRGLRRGGEFVIVGQTRRLKARRTVPSRVLLAADPGLWERCRRFKPYVKVTGSEAVQAAQLWLPPVPTRSTSTASLLTGYTRLGDQLRPIAREVKELVDEIGDIARRFDWDGLPLLTADGWQVQATKYEYDEAVLRDADPATYNALAVDVPGRVTTAIFVRKFDPTSVDEVDGD